ncbi:ubiquitinyl hydrolase [Tilletiaria anomala UBC 951]|uniref:ubiquitinyl hydrolase 1 n=1 Tax=Tilletiaria anomala (strain ATCC 24038 / CBS 436.72 / UBC 951) TaxID=1037660 RepID=A0A066VLV6_TILAU|nr:ubiquitinyl hydrolase [Tilletiaria anomala UBC 951]KDN42727.1 ubiquitinyl hydrolase [Tilletiaria anomala UBC 951]
MHSTGEKRPRTASLSDQNDFVQQSSGLSVTDSILALSGSPSRKKASMNSTDNSATGMGARLQSIACEHLSAALKKLQPPRVSQQVHKEECTLCFDDHDGVNGVDVCLHCFNGGCSGPDSDRQHAKLHLEKTGHAIAVNVKRRAKPKAETNEPEPKPIKLAIHAEGEADKYDYSYVPKCLACNDIEFDTASIAQLQPFVDGVVKSMSSAQQSEVKSWEEEIVNCEHTDKLVQLEEDKRQKIDSSIKTGQPERHCSLCDLTSNLWLCLTCGNLGCGRAQFGGVGGNSHGLAHFKATGHPCSVKQGTITPEGSADVYCYACNDARLDNRLAEHLGNLGIVVANLSKTEKSMTELQVEQNLSFDFSMMGEDGQKLQSVFGPGLTGLRNLGNSCYLASILQSLFSFPSFIRRYGDAYRQHSLVCENPLPAACLECQLGKMADGLLSGRYSVPAPALRNTSEDADEVRFQAGIKPAMFKNLIGKGHSEFATMRQQDADEFFKHIVDCIQKENRRLQSSATAGGLAPGALIDDVTSIFGFELEHRLQCTQCHRVRYKIERQDAGLSLPVPLRPVAETASENMEVDFKQQAPAEGVGSAGAALAPANAVGKVKFEPVSIDECLDLYTGTETIPDYACPQCKAKTIATKQTQFKTFPQVLAIAVRRFQLIGWVPQKVDVKVQVPLGLAEEQNGGVLQLDHYLGHGMQEGEEELPQDENSGDAGGGRLPQFDANAMSQLTAMGFPEIRCQKALLATGNTGDAEAAMTWLFSHMEDADIDDPIDLETYAAASGGTIAAALDTSMLEDMGFSKAQATKALRINNGNAEMAVAWLFENPDDPGEESSTAAVTAADEEVGPSSESTALYIGDASLPARYRLKSFISHKGYVSHIRKLNAEDGWVLFKSSKRLCHLLLKKTCSRMSASKVFRSSHMCTSSSDASHLRCACMYVHYRVSVH